MAGASAATVIPCSRDDPACVRQVSLADTRKTVQPHGEQWLPLSKLKSQCFSRSYASILPTSLGHIAPSTKAYSARSPDAVSVRSVCEGKRGDLRRIFLENRQGSERHKECAAFPVFSDPLHHLKRSRRASDVKEKRELPTGLPALIPSSSSASQPLFPTDWFRNFRRIPFRPTPKPSAELPPRTIGPFQAGFSRELRTDSPMSNCCLHGNLLRFSPAPFSTQ